MERSICKDFLEKCELFKWFVVEYYGDDFYETLVGMAQCGEDKWLSAMLTRVWFELPDSKFNVCVNPPGWHEFLSLIEE